MARAEQEHGGAAPSATAAESAEMAGELATAEVATGPVVAGAVDVADAEVAKNVHRAAGTSQWFRPAGAERDQDSEKSGSSPG